MTRQRDPWEPGEYVVQAVRNTVPSEEIVCGYVRWPFGVAWSRWQFFEGYTITHLPTGRRIGAMGHEFRQKQTAQRVADRLRPLLDWEHLTPEVWAALPSVQRGAIGYVFSEARQRETEARVRV